MEFAVKSRLIAVVTVSMLLLLIVGPPLSPSASRQTAASVTAQEPPAARANEEVRTPPLTPREKTGTWVFLIWMWVSIGFLLYVLRLKVLEADREFRTGLYHTFEEPAEPRNP
jgi:hypothetical protein